MASSASAPPVPSGRTRETSLLRAVRRAAAARWQALPTSWRAPRVLYGIGLLLALVLLIAFQQVLARAVDRAEARRLAWANTRDAITRCVALSDAALRESCRGRALAGIVPPEPPLASGQLARFDP